MIIETITANSDNKTEAYRLLGFMHLMACRSVGTGGDWKLKSTATDSDYAMTAVTNDVVDLIAVTVDGHHTYTMKQCEVEDEN